VAVVADLTNDNPPLFAIGSMITTAFVTIATINFDIIVDFYTQFLGSVPQPYLPQVYAEFSIAGLRLGIFAPKVDRQAEFSQPRQSGMSLCLEVESLEDSIGILAQLGYRPAGEITTASHGREIYADDPDGNRLILHQSPELENR
jgi:catechol 2,3-dioxygenase-like lactoylglutathione lyase family enzyme